MDMAEFGHYLYCELTGSYSGRLPSAPEQMQVDLARERQCADEMEAMPSRRSDDELKQTSVGISQSGKGMGTANLAHQLPAAR